MARGPLRPFEGLATTLGLEPAEFRRLLLMGALVAVLLCAYTIAKVLRDSLFLAEFGALSLPYAYIAVALGSVGFVWLEGQFARRFPRHGATRFHHGFAILFSVAAALALPHARHWTVALFYLWTGSQAMMLIPHFWMLALELWDSRRARAVFPVLAGCGILGGLAGGGFAGWSTPFFHRVGLLWSLPVLLTAVHLLTLAAERHHTPSARTAAPQSTRSPWAILRHSPYLHVFVVAVALSVIVGTLVDFQFKFYLQHLYQGNSAALAQFLGRFYVGLNALSLVFQFGIAGWLLQRIGLGMSSALQPAAVLGLSVWLVAGPGMWVMVALRWTQGVLSQTLDKSGHEIYYTAIRPSERRRIKPAIDTLVERWSDAAVGVLLIVALHVLHVPVPAIAALTGVLCALWLVVLFRLDHQYGKAFQQILSSRWLEPEIASDALRIPAARQALLEALRADDENRIVLALQLSGPARDPAIVRAVRECLQHEWPGVRAAAVSAMEAMHAADTEHRIESFLGEPDEGLRRAAVSYLLVRGPEPVGRAQRLLNGDDDTLRRLAVEVLFERPCEARAALTLAWVDARFAAGAPEQLLLAAYALGAMKGAAPIQRLRALLTQEDLDVRRAALASATRRPARELLDVLLPLLIVPGLHYAAREAVAAIGDAAVTALRELLGETQENRTQAFAASALTHIGTRHAAEALMTLVRGSDLRLRHLGLRGLSRMRLRTGPPVLAREVAHRLFLRELRDYRDSMDPALALAAHVAPEVRLLGDSFRESAEMALERSLQALACWYEPRPLLGAYERLKSSDREIAAPALEFLEHVLPRAMFRPVRRIFEPTSVAPAEVDPSADPLALWIERAWNSEDPWLRACAVRAASFSPGFDGSVFANAGDPDPRVQVELAARLATGTKAIRVSKPAASLDAAAAC